VIHKTARRRLVEVPPWPTEVQDEAVAVLMRLASEGAPHVAAHMERTERLARAFVKELGLGEPLARLVRLTARLHDIGKLGVPPRILEKPGPLTEFELALMREHTLIGQEMLERRPELLQIGPLVRSTHEWWDGTGYPDGLSGGEIPLPSRIVAICDAFDSMTKPRSYSHAMTIPAALRELQDCAGAQFDPGAVEVFCRLFKSRFDRWAERA
jgi:two-component system, cell cycle response regulator